MKSGVRTYSFERGGGDVPSNYVSDSNQLPDSSQEVDSSDSNLRSVFRSNFAKFDWDKTGLNVDLVS